MTVTTGVDRPTFDTVDEELQAWCDAACYLAGILDGLGTVHGLTAADRIEASAALREQQGNHGAAAVLRWVGP